ncbi:MAG: sigma factor [Chloroflexota bacterium]
MASPSLELPVDDLALARALARKDRGRLPSAGRQQTGAVFRTCYRVLGSVSEAEDAVQETFVLAFRALGSYRGDGPPGAWLARIAVREEAGAAAGAGPEAHPHRAAR